MGPLQQHQPGEAWELRVFAARGALAGLAVELLGASLGWSLELRLSAALGAAVLAAGPREARLALDPGRLRFAAAGSWLGLACAAVFLPLLCVWLLPEGSMAAWVRPRVPQLAGPLWVAVLSSAIAAPAMEELLHRGLIQRGLSRALGAGPAGLLSAAGFTAVHGLAGAGAGPQHFLAGLALAAVAERSRGWWAPAMLHAAGNLGWLLAARVLAG
ncbi:MAG: membrane protease YdiL (CAAX protease family) [Planctomycetota bacterium]